MKSKKYICIRERINSFNCVIIPRFNYQKGLNTIGKNKIIKKKEQGDLHIDHSSYFVWIIYCMFIQNIIRPIGVVKKEKKKSQQSQLRAL